MQEKVFTFTVLFSFSAEVSGEFADRPTCVLKFSEGGERPLPPETFARKWDFASPWETISNLVALSFILSHKSGAPPWEGRNSEGDFSATWCGQKRTSSWAGLLNEWWFQLQGLKEQKEMAGLNLADGLEKAVMGYACKKGAVAGASTPHRAWHCCSC